MKFKAILLGVCCSLMAAGTTAYAQTEIAHFGGTPHFNVIPKSLTKTDAPVLYSCETNESNYIYRIYDTDFNVVKQFTVEISCPQERVVTYERHGGDWVVVSDESELYIGYETHLVSYLDCDLDGYNIEGWWNEDGSILFQNVFSTGGKYESLRPIYTMSTVADTSLFEYENFQRMTVRYGVHQFSGIELLEDGVAVKKFDIPLIEDWDDCEVLVIKLGGVFYMCFYCWDTGSYVYRIDPVQSSISLVKTFDTTRMYPNVIRPGDAVNIDFGAGDTSVAGELIVTDAVGRVVERRPVPAGSGTLQIGTRRLHAGTYNFTVYRAGKPADNGKIIIR